MYNAGVFDDPRAKKYLLSALAVLTSIVARYYFLVLRGGGAIPQIEIRGYEVMPFEANGRGVANVLIENTGGGGTIQVYSSAGFALPTTDARDIKRQLEQNTDELVARDLGGVELTLKAKQQGSFTVSGLRPTPEQLKATNQGELKFYFSGTMIVDGGKAEQKFCGFVVASKPSDVMACPED